MKEIILKSLDIRNFKGINSLVVNFGTITSIFGTNATKKTSINDAFRWLLFGKDSTDRSVFEIKPLDENNNQRHNVEIQVTGIFLIDGIEMKFSRTLKENWQRARNSTVSKFKGNETSFEINDAPLKLNEFQNEINSIVSENNFKIITDPFYFSTKINWTERRKTLVSFSGGFNDSEILNSDEKFEPLRELFIKHKSEDKIKDSLNSQKKKLNEELKLIPARIDENNSQIAEIDGKNLKADLDIKKASLEKIETQIFNKDLIDINADNKKLLSSKKEELKGIDETAEKLFKDSLRDHINNRTSLESSIKANENLISTYNNSISTTETNIHDLEKSIDDLRNDYIKIQEEEFLFDEHLTSCPACKRKFEKSVIDGKKKELEENFNTDKVKRKNLIKENGDKKKELLEVAKNNLAAQKNDLYQLNKKIELEAKQFEEVTEIIRTKNEQGFDVPKNRKILFNEIVELETKINRPIQKDEALEELKLQKESLKSEIDSIHNQLGKVQTNENLNKRIAELEERERTISQQIADLEKVLFALESFIKTKVSYIEDKINSRFSFVKFKLFKENINGSIEETCEALICGVPFSDANTASKYNAGIDIINTLSDHYQVKAPIFIDGAESVVAFENSNSQLIKLIVSENDKKLRIEKFNNKLNEVA
ncbi:MAG: AAA family ATPase [Labilibaculum sp.]|nr:AAA family ATPase [Labilibaculum sp.]MBI9060156.1 AAA family ATPase [Labilibaculum sp.]